MLGELLAEVLKARLWEGEDCMWAGFSGVSL